VGFTNPALPLFFPFPWVDVYLLLQVAFPSGGLYFKNDTWRKETANKHVIVHNNYVVGLDQKIKRFRDRNLWLVEVDAISISVVREERLISFHLLLRSLIHTFAQSCSLLALTSSPSLFPVH
jgi:hypothetical protein